MVKTPIKRDLDKERRDRIRRAAIAAARKALAQLDDDERASLATLRADLLKPTIPEPHAEKLIAVKLAQQKLGGLVLTGVGKIAARLVDPPI